MRGEEKGGFRVVDPLAARVQAELGHQALFGEFHAKNLASSSNDLQDHELFGKCDIKLGGGTGWPSQHTST